MEEVVGWGRLPDEAIVIRGGILEYAVLVRNVLDYELRHPGRYRASVACLPWLAVEEIAVIARRAGLLPHSKVCVATIGAVRDRGFEVVLTNASRAHAPLVFEGVPTRAGYDRLTGPFIGPIDNPALR